jgi:V/A-type H+/Na+-transporting ATPase subunit I
MTSASIICVRKDVESVLEALSSFGEFQIEPSTGEEKNISEIEQSIVIAKQALSDANNLTKQLVDEKASFFAMFKVSLISQVAVTVENWQSLLDYTSQNIAALKTQADSLTKQLTDLAEKKISLSHIKDMLGQMQQGNADLVASEELKLIQVRFASLPAKNFSGLETAIAGLPSFINRCSMGKEVVFVFIALPAKYSTELDRILKIYHAEIFHIPAELPKNIDEALKGADKQLQENHEKEKQVRSELRNLGEDNKDNLASWSETSQNILNLLDAETKILKSGRLARVSGFVPVKKFSELNQKVSGMLEGKVVVLSNGAVKETNPPTRILNSRFVKPFEELTRLYGLPKYNEIDPTPILSITFPIIFGLMFGDVGHGLVLLVGGLTIGLLIKNGQGMKNICYIMAACGLVATITGLLFGEIFGMQLFPPLWFSPFEGQGNVFNFMIFCLYIGIVQIISGIVIEMVNFAVKHQYADVLLTSAPKIAFYIGGVYIIAFYQLNFEAWLNGPILAAVLPFVILVVGKPIYLKVAKLKQGHMDAEHAEMDTISGRLFEGGDFFTRLLSNTISYTRIMALLMAHWALLLVVYEVSGLIGTGNVLSLILGGIVIVGGNIFVIALEGLIVFIHTLRLHFYEWFSKFYAGTGVEFKPFQTRFTRTKLTLRNKETKR